MTIRERIIGWLGGVGRGERDLLTTLYEARVRDVDSLSGELEECHEARRTAVANFELAELDRRNMSRRLDAVRSALADD